MGRPESSFGPRINDRIRITPVRLIDENGEMVGVVETDDARRRAMEAGLDLVEIAADVRPPVCKIMDFGKYKYELSKKDKQGKKSKGSEMKEVRLGRSMKIDPHDVEIRVNQALRFLLEGHKVQIVANYRGRELAHKQIGEAKLDDVVKKLCELGRLESAPKLAGKRLTAIIAPDRSKVEPFKRKHPEFAKVKTTAEKPAKERVEVTPEGRQPSGGGERLQISANAADSGDAQD
ncbi:MAG: translation initiation factor IF-3 [Planctomycetes bacterium]|nr:translation initiation factor IF-3 [Planctomycetota bacterium]